MSARDKLNIMRKYKIVFLGDQSGKYQRFSMARYR